MPLAALGLIVAVWISLQISQSRPSAESGRAQETATPADLPGFRSDAWFLPDEELLGFIEIPAGPFLMGSDAAIDAQAFDIERWSQARAQGTVDLPAFYIGRYEVTVAQFRAFAEATGYRALDDESLRGRLDHPMVGVSWTDALAYGRWLEEVLLEWPETPPRLSRLLRDGWRVGLPSEAEWEKAARGADGRIYPWGNEPRRDRANYGGGTTPVGSFDCPECPFGLADMSGNVWEWTRSPYQPYPYDPTDDGQDLDAEALWVMRGGSFGYPERDARAASRGGADPGARRAFIGFRLVVSPF